MKNYELPSEEFFNDQFAQIMLRIQMSEILNEQRKAKIMEGYYAGDGLYFKRNENNTVTVTKMKSANFKETEVLFQQTLPEGIWCSAVCTVSNKGEGFGRWYDAMKFHND